MVAPMDQWIHDMDQYMLDDTMDMKNGQIFVFIEDNEYLGIFFSD